MTARAEGIHLPLQHAFRLAARGFTLPPLNPYGDGSAFHGAFTPLRLYCVAVLLVVVHYRCAGQVIFLHYPVTTFAFTLPTVVRCLHVTRSIYLTHRTPRTAQGPVAVLRVNVDATLPTDRSTVVRFRAAHTYVRHSASRPRHARYVLAPLPAAILVWCERKKNGRGYLTSFSPHLRATALSASWFAFEREPGRCARRA